MPPTLLFRLASIGGIHLSSATAQPACARPAHPAMARNLLRVRARVRVRVRVRVKVKP